jgi:hypothetical protein
MMRQEHCQRLEEIADHLGGAAFTDGDTLDVMLDNRDSDLEVLIKYRS